MERAGARSSRRLPGARLLRAREQKVSLQVGKSIVSRKITGAEWKEAAGKESSGLTSVIARSGNAGGMQEELLPAGIHRHHHIERGFPLDQRAQGERPVIIRFGARCIARS